MEDDFATNRNGRVFHRTVQQAGFGLGAFTGIGYNLRGEFLMMTDPATAIKREVLQLVDRQIETLRHEGRMTDSALADYHTRSEKSFSSIRRWIEWEERASTCESPGRRRPPWFEGARPPLATLMVSLRRRPCCFSYSTRGDES